MTRAAGELFGAEAALGPELVRVEWPGYFADGRTCRVIERGTYHLRNGAELDLVVIAVKGRDDDEVQVGVPPDRLVPLTPAESEAPPT